MTTGSDKCLRCDSALRIVSVKFGFTGARLVTLCPDCTLAKVDSSVDAEAEPATEQRRSGERTAQWLSSMNLLSL